MLFELIFSNQSLLCSTAFAQKSKTYQAKNSTTINSLNFTEQEGYAAKYSLSLGILNSNNLKKYASLVGGELIFNYNFAATSFVNLNMGIISQLYEDKNIILIPIKSYEILFIKELYGFYSPTEWINIYYGRKGEIFILDDYRYNPFITLLSEESILGGVFQFSQRIDSFGLYSTSFHQAHSEKIDKYTLGVSLDKDLDFLNLKILPKGNLSYVLFNDTKDLLSSLALGKFENFPKIIPASTRYTLFTGKFGIKIEDIPFINSSQTEVYVWKNIAEKTANMGLLAATSITKSLAKYSLSLKYYFSSSGANSIPPYMLTTPHFPGTITSQVYAELGYNVSSKQLISFAIDRSYLYKAINIPSDYIPSINATTSLINSHGILMLFKYSENL